MPPRQNEPILGPLDIRYEPVTVDYDIGTGTYTDGTRYYPENTVTRATINADGLNFTMPVPTFDYLEVGNNNITRAEFEYRLDALKSKIYKIISEHIKLDITEEEFMDLLKE